MAPQCLLLAWARQGRLTLSLAARTRRKLGGLGDAQALQCLAGTAPVSFQSGQIHRAICGDSVTSFFDTLFTFGRT